MGARLGLAMLIGLPVFLVMFHGAHGNIAIYWNSEFVVLLPTALGLALPSAGTAGLMQGVRFLFARELTADERRQARQFYGAFGRGLLGVAIIINLIAQIIVLQNLGTDFGAIGGALGIGIVELFLSIGLIELVLVPLCDGLDRPSPEIPSRQHSGLPSLGVELALVAVVTGMHVVVLMTTVGLLLASRLSEPSIPG